MKRFFNLQVFVFCVMSIFATPYLIKPGLRCEQFL